MSDRPNRSTTNITPEIDRHFSPPMKSDPAHRVDDEIFARRKPRGA